MPLPRRTVLFIALSAFLLCEPSRQAGTARAAVAPSVDPLPGISEGTSTPVRLASDKLGNLYVADPRGGGILRYNSSGKLLQKISAGREVSGIALAQNGDLLASQGSSVAVYSPGTGALVSRFGSFGKAGGIAVDASGFVYVTDSTGNCVQVFNASYAPVATGVAAAGQPSNSFGGKGLSAGQFFQPTGISYEKVSRQLAVADTLNGRIQFFSTQGAFQSSLGAFGSGPLKFTSPQGIAFEYSPDGATLVRMYVVDSFQSNVQVIDAATLSFLRNIGSYGVAAGKLVLPADLLFDQFDPLNSRLLVANGAGNVALFRIDAAVGSGPAAPGPLLTLDTLPVATNLATLVVSGRTASGARVTVNGTPVTVAGGTWSGTVTLSPGSNLITVSASDPTGTTVASASVTLLGTGGTTPLVALALTSVPSVTGVTPLTISGTVTSGATVSVNGTAANVTGTTWSIAVNLNSGSNNFQVTASKAGLGDSTQSFNITLDSSVPVLTALLLQNNATTSTPVQTISGSVSDSASATVLVNFNGASQSVPVVNGQYSVSVPLSVGANSVTVTAVDAAGNASAPVARTLYYDPQAPAASVTTPNGTVSAAPTMILTGTAPEGCLVSVNSLPATTSGAQKAVSNKAAAAYVPWSIPVTLSTGTNYFEVKVTDPTTGKSSSTAQTVSYQPGAPALAVSYPLVDLATAKKSLTVTGTVTPGATASAWVNGSPAAVTVSDAGSFSVRLPDFSAPGSYAVLVSATDSSGATSTTTRSVIYNPAVPAIQVLSEAPLKVSASGGALVAKDKNGPVGGLTVSGDTATLDLAGVSYDPATLNVYAVTNAGTSTRNGDLDGDGLLGIRDALRALQIASGELTMTAADRLRGDVSALVNGVAVPDGGIDGRDALMILRALVGSITLY